ncbi:annexin A2-like [Scyliorhinus canicula]|uniref:annexin A2-like n=1 Tax=Scyliorhinus canicula TaxID=7830 RepID=UPI0018F5D4D5|nr:annexin A2-like [Scyliorhinus canicula]
MADVHNMMAQVSLTGDDLSGGATVKPFVDFVVENDAAALQKALETKGIDEHTIIDVLTKRSNAQRQDIAFAFEKRTKRNLEEVLDIALSEYLRTIILALMKTPAKYDAIEIKGAVKGLGTNEDTLIEILCSRTNKQIQDMSKAYQEIFKKDMIKDIRDDTSQHFRELLTALAQGNRSEPSNVIDNELIDTDARELYAGDKKSKPDIEKWITIMTKRSIPHLQRVFGRYKTYSSCDIIESIKHGVKADLRTTFLALVQCIQNKPEFFNDKLCQSTIKRSVLTRIVVSRSEIDLQNIKKEFKKKTGQTLHQYLSSSTRGDYQRVMLALCGGDD